MSQIIELLAALLAGGFLTLIYKNRQQDLRKHQDYKESRYKCIIMLLHAKLNFEKNKNLLNQYGYEIQNILDLDDLLEAELVNSYLFASRSFISSFEKFISEPSHSTRIDVAKAMRKDLWGLN